MTVFIYVLKDPKTGAIRYVGKTKNVSERLRQHAYPKRKSHLACWVRSLLKKGLTPVLEVIDEVLEEFWQQWEVAYIEFFREQGCALTNANDGGGGGHNPSIETRRKIGLAKVGNLYFLGKKHSEETKLKIGAANAGHKYCVGRKLSLTTKAKIGKATRGRRHSLGAKMKMSDGHVGKKYSNASSDFVGVFWSMYHRRWLARLWLGPKNVKNIGGFEKIEDAVFARALAVANLDLTTPLT